MEKRFTGLSNRLSDFNCLIRGSRFPPRVEDRGCSSQAGKEHSGDHGLHGVQQRRPTNKVIQKSRANALLEAQPADSPPSLGGFFDLDDELVFLRLDSEFETGGLKILKA